MKVLSIFILLTGAYSQEQIIIAEGMTGQELLDFVVENYKPAEVLSWEHAKDTLYSVIDLQENSQLSCVYTGYTITLNTGVDPSTDADSQGINAEHTYPQSMGADNEPMKSDMHHLYPVRAAVNSSRNNAPYYDIDDSKTDVWFHLGFDQSNIPTENIDSYSEKENDTPDKFEPREDHKGNAARSVFYFYAMYQDSASYIFFTLQKNTMKKWHYEDIVDMSEYDRSFTIAEYQDNKPNPFVLDSTLARRIWFNEPPQPAYNIKINEIHYNPSSEQGSDNDYEFIELFNAESFSVNLFGYHFTEGLSHFFNDDLTLEPEGYLLLAKNGEMYSGSIEWAYGNLGNSGETLILINSDGDLANELTFENSSPFPSEPNGSGPSMELIDPDADNTLGINWQASTILGGTPGFPNSVYSTTAVITIVSPNGGELWMQGTTHNIFWASINLDEDVIIELYQDNELSSTLSAGTENNGSYEWVIPMSQADGNNYTVKVSGSQDNDVFDVSNAYFSIIPFSAPSEVIITEIMQNPASVSDANGEWFEIYNSGSSNIDINGWIISDNGSDNHLIDDEIIISSSQYFVFGRNADIASNGGVNVDYEYSGFTLGNSDDEIVIFSSDGVTEIDRVEYDGGQSWPDPTGASMTLSNLASDNNIGSNWQTSDTAYGDGDLGTPGQSNFGIQGDVNGDGQVNVLDIVLAVNIILADEYNVIADVNQDGELNVLDLVILVNWVLYP